MGNSGRHLRFCGYCGAPASLVVGSNGEGERLLCSLCDLETIGDAYKPGPALLVLALIFADDKLLLIKRGLPPYRDKWAPPGGFVEAGESLETATIREVEEEVGVHLKKEELWPHAIISLPALNQVHVSFLACLSSPCPLKPSPPEALDARWFSESAIAGADIWEASHGYESGIAYQIARNKRLDIYQQSDDFLRLLLNDGSMRYLWRRL